MNRLAETGRNFMEYTSLHGLSRIADAKFWLKKLVWCLLFLGSLGMCFFQVTRLFEQFYNFQVNTKIVLQNEVQTFPGVAICNVNPTQYEHTVNIPQLFRIIRTLSINTGIALEEFSLGEVYVDTAAVRFSTPKDPLHTSISKIKKIRDPFYGICYSLESKHLVFGPGQSYGLEVLLNIDQHNYLPFIAQSEGISLQIYDTNYFPDVAAAGISLPVGFEVDIGITKKIFHRLPGPNEICDDQNIFDSMQSCIQLCIDVLIREVCHCARTYIHKEEENNISYCISDDDVKCLLHNLENLETDQACPDCKSPCKQTTYEKSVSMKKWPSVNFEPYVKKFENHSLTSKDFMKLRVYFTSLLTETISEDMAYTSENFVSDIGGQLGLWIGMSVLSMAEVIELVFLLIYACIRKTKTEDVQTTTVNQRKAQSNILTIKEID